MADDLDPAAVLDGLLKAARAAGADAADASYSERESTSIDVRLGAVEGVEREEARSVALRALVGKRQAAATTTDLSRAGLEALAERVTAMAKAAPEDPYCGLLDPAYRASGWAALDLNDPTRLTPDDLERLARTAEEAALAVPGVTNSAGAGASFSASHAVYATSDGFLGAQRGGAFGLGVAPLAERDGLKERDHEGRTVRFFADLPPPDEIGRRAGERAAARLGGRKIESRKAAVIFENRTASRVISPMLGAISGAAVARGVSFLKDAMGQAVFGPHVTIEDDPLRPRGLSSKPFDGEGGRVQKRNLIDQGVLTTWLLNASAARQLGLEPTGHASWGHGGPPGIGASNVTVLPGPRDLAGLMSDAGQGLLVVEMFSPSLNANTGDYSVGVAGFWFENGAIAHPVNEVTVAGNLKDIYARLVPGADLERRGGLDSPSLLVEDLAIAGV